MQTQEVFEHDMPASERLGAISGKVQELLNARKELVKGLSARDGDDVVIALMSGLDLDDTLGKRYGDVQTIDKSIDALRAAARRVADELEHEKAIAGRKAREEKKAAYTKALKGYLSATKRLAAADASLKEVNDELRAEGHTAFDNVAFPGIRVPDFAKSEQIFIDTCRMRGFDV